MLAAAAFVSVSVSFDVARVDGAIGAQSGGSSVFDDARERSSRPSVVDEGCNAEPDAYVLYAMSAHNNQYQTVALESFLSSMASELELTRSECSESYPQAEPWSPVG